MFAVELSLICLSSSMTVTADTVTFYMFQPICAGTEKTCGWPAGGSLDIAAQIMVKQINQRGMLRGNFSLRIIVRDDHCDPAHGLEQAVRILLKSKEDWPFGVVGSGCSGVTKSIIPMFSLARVPLISHAATATYLSDRTRYTNFFRMFPPDGPQIKVWFTICKRFGWTKIALIYDELTYPMADYAEGVVDSYGGDMVNVLSGSHEAVMSRNTIRAANILRNAVLRSRVRAVMAILYAPSLRMILCQLAKRHVRGMYVFHLGWLASGWQYEGLDSLSCSVEEMDTITEYSFSAFPEAYHDDEHATSACALPNFTIRDFDKMYNAQLQALDEEVRTEASYTADAVCMMALLFNEMMDYTGNFEDLINMNARTYRMFVSKAQAIRFLGFSGPVWFPANASAYGAGDRITPLTVFQKIDGNVTRIGVYNEGDITFLPGKSFHFAGGRTSPPGAEFDKCGDGKIFDFQTEQCQICPDNRMFSTWQYNCVCKPGYQATNGTCVACNTGSFADFFHSPLCELCEEGHFAAHVGMSSCMRCPLGKYTDLNGSVTCSDCPAHQTTHFLGAKMEGDCICEVGYYLDVSSNGCLSCGILETTDAVGARSAEECYMREAVKMILAVAACGLCGVIALSWILFKLLRRRIHKLEAKQKRYYGEVIRKATDSVMSLDHPMVIIRADTFLELGHLISHEQLRSEGKLVFLDTLEMITDFKTQHNILFLSHQWLGWGRPDPEDVHYNTMSAAIRNAIDRADIYDDGLKAPLCEWYVWCDYVSIAQASRKIQTLAIMSLPVYAIVAHAFVIVAPTCQHCDSGKACNMDTYMRRGWCRAEMLSKLCGSGVQRMYIARTTSGDLSAVTGEFFNMIDFRVFQGDFSCCSLCHRQTDICDKQNLVAASLGLYALILKQRELPWAAEVLHRIEKSKTDYFPTTFTFMKEGVPHQERELFGPLVRMMEEHMESLNLDENTDKDESQGWDQLMCNVQSSPSFHVSPQVSLSVKNSTWVDDVANVFRDLLRGSGLPPDQPQQPAQPDQTKQEALHRDIQISDNESVQLRWRSLVQRLRSVQMEESFCLSEQADQEESELYTFPRSL